VVSIILKRSQFENSPPPEGWQSAATIFICPKNSHRRLTGWFVLSINFISWLLLNV